MYPHVSYNHISVYKYIQVGTCVCTSVYKYSVCEMPVFASVSALAKCVQV